VSATDRLYLAEGMPTIVWGDRDPMTPAAHGLAAHARIPPSRLELFDEDAERFAEVLGAFVAGSPAAVYDEDEMRRRLIEGAPA
jgi:pimeloyl-ACP methyl ester carboxylesterase